MTNVLIVNTQTELAEVWQSHLKRHGIDVLLCVSEDCAVRALERHDIDVMIVDLLLEDGRAFSIADIAQFRQPNAQLIFVTRNSFFSDGSIFNLCANARAVVQNDTPPEDLVAMVDHYAQRAVSRPA